MKKIISFIIVMGMLLSLPCIAAGSDSTRIDYAEEGISVIFSDDTKLTQDKRQEIADRIVYGTQQSDVMPASLLCTLFGHKTSVEEVIVIHHKVRSKSPRCLKECIDVETCSRCDYENQTVTFQGNIDCCPED